MSFSFRHANSYWSVSGGGPTPAELAAQLFDDGMGGVKKGALLDRNDLTSMFVERDGTGGNPSLGGVVGVWLDKKHMGGKTASQYMADEGISDPLLVPGQHTISSTDSERPVLAADGWDTNGTAHTFFFTSNPLTGATQASAITYAKHDAMPPVDNKDGPLWGNFGSNVSNSYHPINSDSTLRENFGLSIRPNLGDMSSVGTDWFELHTCISSSNVISAYIDGGLLGSSATPGIAWGASPRLFNSNNSAYWSGMARSFLFIEEELTGNDLIVAQNFVKA